MNIPSSETCLKQSCVDSRSLSIRYHAKSPSTSYNLAFKLKIVAEAEAVENNSEIARVYGISESMVHRCRKDQENLFTNKTAK